MYLTAALLLVTLASASCQQQTWDRDFWKGVNEDELAKALKKPNTGVAKNLVLAIGDGMGPTTTTAIRVYKGQKTPGMLGEEATLTWDIFPHTGNSKITQDLCEAQKNNVDLGLTYCTDMMTVDSAASGTAYHTGVKTKYEAVGVDDTVIREDCDSVANATVTSVLDWALAAGKSVGIVTTDTVVGASPAGSYAHAAFRNWYSDTDMPQNSKCKDIARQLIEDNLDIQVVLGGGRKYFFPNTTKDREEDSYGSRGDNRKLPEEWITGQTVIKKRFGRAKYVETMNEFDMITADNTEYLFGLFASGRMQEEVERKINRTEPSLTGMVEKAISILSKNPNGFYLFVEGANIDIGHHENRARKALEEGLEFDRAVAKVMEMTSTDDTLVVVSADHSHAFSFGGYSHRGQSILSIANQSYYPSTDLSGKHWTVLSYGNGPGFVNASARQDLTAEYYEQDRVYPSTIPLKSETHGGEDVQIFASGPMSHLFTGVHEQTFIAHGMAYAACIGANKDHCRPGAPALDRTTQGGSGTNNQLSIILLVTMAVITGQS